VAVKAPGVIVIGGYINGLGLVRALSARGIPTAVIATKAYDIAHRSCCVVSSGAALDVDERPESLLELLDRRAAEWAGWALLPSNDEALAALAQHRESLSRTHCVMAPLWDVAQYFLDKGKMQGLAESVGVTMPCCYGEAKAPVPDVGFPVLVKPVLGYKFAPRFGCKLFVARNRAELESFVAQVSKANVPCLLYEHIPGRDSDIYVYCVYMDGKGEPSAGLTMRKLRQSPPFFGVTRVAEIVPEEAGLREATVEMLRRVGFRGMAEAEFKRDERDGRFRFLEINGRSILPNSLLRRAGLDLGWMTWSDYVEGRAESAHPNGWPGVWVNLHADFAYSTVYRRCDPIGLREFLAPYRRPVIEAVWSLRDPLPFLTQWARTVRRPRGTCSPNHASIPSVAPSR